MKKINQLSEISFLNLSRNSISLKAKNNLPVADNRICIAFSVLLVFLIVNALTLNFAFSQVSVNYLVVAGGGGGSGGSASNTFQGNGGGAGGFLTGSTSVSPQAYTITVGAGGAGGIGASNGSNGNASSFGSLVSAIGGGAGKHWNVTGGTGGSGGALNGPGTAGQGNNGGDGSGSAANDGGGGGGASAAGTHHGGAGSVSSISGSSVTYAGGGGGGGSINNGGSGGAGGVGGGGAGGANGANGTANTGGGGGGANWNGSSGGSGGSGGSGIVIISATIGLISNPASAGGIHTTSGGNDIWTFTSSGTWTPTLSSTITLSANAPSVANQCAGTTKVVIQSFSLAVTNSNGNLTGIGFTTTGSYTQADITKYQLYKGTVNNINDAGTAQLGVDLASSGNAGTRSFAAFTSPTLTSGVTYYFWITADIASSVTNGHTIAVNEIATGDLTSTSTKAGSASAGNTQTLKSTPTTATNGSAQIISTTGSATLSGNIPSIGSGAWTVVSGPSTSSSQFGSTSVYNTTFTPAGGAGSYVVRWSISNSPCTSSDADATISVVIPTPATVDWNNSNVQEITLTANRSLLFTNGKSGGLYTLFIKQNNTGGYMIIWPANIRWTSGTAPTLITTPNSVAFMKFAYDGSNYFENGINQY
ncbi:MAG: hypothetical protein HGB12_00110 [Bacteroidetes bacterium]|nr:hypothetical protein [Bacteroidota bacterium]